MKFDLPLLSQTSKVSFLFITQRVSMSTSTQLEYGTCSPLQGPMTPFDRIFTYLVTGTKSRDWFGTPCVLSAAPFTS